MIKYDENGYKIHDWLAPFGERADSVSYLVANSNGDCLPARTMDLFMVAWEVLNEVAK